MDDSANISASTEGDSSYLMALAVQPATLASKISGGTSRTSFVVTQTALAPPDESQSQHLAHFGLAATQLETQLETQAAPPSGRAIQYVIEPEDSNQPRSGDGLQKRTASEPSPLMFPAPRPLRDLNQRAKTLESDRDIVVPSSSPLRPLVVPPPTINVITPIAKAPSTSPISPHPPTPSFLSHISQKLKTTPNFAASTPVFTRAKSVPRGTSSSFKLGSSRKRELSSPDPDSQDSFAGTHPSADPNLWIRTDEARALRTSVVNLGDRRKSPTRSQARSLSPESPVKQALRSRTNTRTITLTKTPSKWQSVPVLSGNAATIFSPSQSQNAAKILVPDTPLNSSNESQRHGSPAFPSGSIASNASSQLATELPSILPATQLGLSSSPFGPHNNFAERYREQQSSSVMSSQSTRSLTPTQPSAIPDPEPDITRPLHRVESSDDEAALPDLRTASSPAIFTLSNRVSQARSRLGPSSSEANVETQTQIQPEACKHPATGFITDGRSEISSSSRQSTPHRGRSLSVSVTGGQETGDLAAVEDLIEPVEESEKIVLDKRRVPADPEDEEESDDIPIKLSANPNESVEIPVFTAPAPRARAPVARKVSRKRGAKAPPKTERKSSAKGKGTKPALKRPARKASAAPSPEASDSEASSSSSSAGGSREPLVERPPISAVRSNSSKRKRSPSAPTPSKRPKMGTSRVFAQWRDGGYYVGTVGNCNSVNETYQILFDDGEEKWVSLLHLRADDLRVGDDVLVLGGVGKYGRVHDVSNWGTSSGQAVVILAEPKKGLKVVESQDLRVESVAIEADWGDRILKPEDIKPASHYLVSTPTDSKKGSRGNSRATSVAVDKKFVVGQSLARKGFVITHRPSKSSSSSASGDADAFKADLAIRIKRAGGVVADDWDHFFVVGPKYVKPGDKKSTWESGKEGVKWVGPEGIDGVFLLSDNYTVTPKYLMALALGVPCVSHVWATDMMNGLNVPWAGYLLTAGYSDKLKCEVSQVVDSKWCSDRHVMINIMANNIIRRPFEGYKVAIIVSKAKSQPTDKLPHFVCAAGAARVELVASAKAASHPLDECDVVIVQDSIDKKLLKQLREGGATCQNVTWLKQSLIMGVAQP